VDEETLAGNAKEKVRAMIENGEPKKAVCKLQYSSFFTLINFMNSFVDGL